MNGLPPLRMDPLPAIDLRHLFVLSDDTGILQHATRATPDLHHGYCTDDNARALIAAVMIKALPEDAWAHASQPGVADLLVVTQRYLAFLAYAYNSEGGRFRNFMLYDRSWLEKIGSEDSHARTIWALGQACRLAPNGDIQHMADQLMQQALAPVDGFQYLRPWAYSLLGLDEYLQVHPEQERAQRLRRRMSERLFDIWQYHSCDEWPWWEDHLTWGNAKLPHAMLVAGGALARTAAVEGALGALRWLLEIQTGEQGQLTIIGNRGWYARHQGRARYDQQPIEAKALVQACLAAARATRDDYWVEQATRCFEWFTGRNDAGLPLYNPETGGGQDGLGADGINPNQGAESTLAYLMSVLELHHYDRAQRAEKERNTPTLF